MKIQTQSRIVYLREDTYARTVENFRDKLKDFFEKHYNDLFSHYNIMHWSSPNLLKFLKPWLETEGNFEVYDKSLPEYKARKFLVVDREIVLRNGQYKKSYMNAIYEDVYNNVIVDLELMAGRSWENQDWRGKLDQFIIKSEEWKRKDPTVTLVLVLAIPNKYTYGSKQTCTTSPFELTRLRLWSEIAHGVYNPKTIPNIILIGYGERI